MFAMLNPFASGAEAIDPVDAVTRVKAGKAVLVDVREPGEFAQGHAQGAINVPVGEVSRRANPKAPDCLPEFSSGKPLILYCASGARSGMAGKLFRKLGHTEIFNLGSLNDWQAGGGRTTR